MNFVQELRLPSPIYRETPPKCWYMHWDQKCVGRTGTRISLWDIPGGKQDYLFIHSVAPGNFPRKSSKKSCSFYFLTRISWRLFVNSERVFRQGTVEGLLRIKGPLKEPWVVKFTRQLLSAVNFLHTNGKKHIIHKDIKG